MPNHRLFCFSLIISLLLLAACNSQRSETESSESFVSGSVAVEDEVVSLDDIEVVTGQTIYVPAYSEIFFEDTDRTWDFAVTLAVHNTNLDKSIIVKSVKYYDTNGQLVKEFLPEPIRLDKLVTRGYLVGRSDNRGGIGANFVVEWVADAEVTPPVVEAVLISAAGTQGLSLITPGRVIAEFGPQEGD